METKIPTSIKLHFALDNEVKTLALPFAGGAEADYIAVMIEMPFLIASENPNEGYCTVNCLKDIDKPLEYKYNPEVMKYYSKLIDNEGLEKSTGHLAVRRLVEEVVEAAKTNSFIILVYPETLIHIDVHEKLIDDFLYPFAKEHNIKFLIETNSPFILSCYNDCLVKTY
jgi:hypothetical protein